MKYFIIPLLFLISTGLYSQNNLWTLERCIQYALENNISIKQSELNEEIFKNNYEQSKIALLPTVSANASQNFNFGNSVDPTTFEFVRLNTKSNSFGVSASLPLFTGLQQINNVRMLKFDKEASQQDLMYIRDQMALTITTYFLNILMNREIYQSSLKQIETTTEQYNNTRKLVDAGALPEGDLLDIEAQIADDELRATQAENNLELSKLRLQLLLQLDPSGDFNVIAPELSDPDENVSADYDPTAIYDEAVTKRPEIKAEEYRLQSSQVGEQIAKGALYPTLTLNTAVRTSYFSEDFDQAGIDTFVVPSMPIGYLEDNVSENVLSFPSTEFVPIIESKRFGDQLSDNMSESISFNLSIPIFGGWQRMTNVQNAKLAAQISKFSLIERKNLLQEEINEAYTNAVAASKTFASAKKSYEAFERSLEYAEEKYRLGTINSLDYLTVKNRMAISESDLLTAKYEYIFKLKILDFYAGNPISLEMK